MPKTTATLCLTRADPAAAPDLVVVVGVAVGAVVGVNGSWTPSFSLVTMSGVGRGCCSSSELVCFGNEALEEVITGSFESSKRPDAAASVQVGASSWIVAKLSSVTVATAKLEHQASAQLAVVLMLDTEILRADRIVLEGKSRIWERGRLCLLIDFGEEVAVA